MLAVGRQKKFSQPISDGPEGRLEPSMSKLPSGPTQDEPPPTVALTCRTKAGEPYCRHQSVEAEISAARRQPHNQWPSREWRLETLAHLIRLRSHDNDPEVLGRLTHTFLERVKPIVDRWSRGYGTADSEEIQIEVSNRLGDLLMQPIPTRTSEYLEVDAATVIKQITLRAKGKDRPKANAFQSADRDEEGFHTSTVERLADGGLDPLEHLLAKTEAKAGGPLRLLHAITDPRHREAFILREFYDWPVKDAPPGVPTLCSRFKVSDRQIRNWIKIAIDQMRAAHGAES